MLTIMALGLGSIALMLGFLIGKVCKLIHVTKPDQPYTGNFYIILGILMALFMTVAWLGEGGALQ